MRMAILGVLAPLASTAPALAAQTVADAPPSWAFSADPPAVQPASRPPDDGVPKHVAGSAVALTLAQTRDPFNIPDWHPSDHPAAPDIVMHGRKPAVLACGYCHLPNGQGRPENASLAGLPADYILQQIRDLRSGARKSSVSDLKPPALMVGIAKAVSDEDVEKAAAYFASIKPRPWIRVVETETVPRTHIAGFMLVADASGTAEPIGQRIVETPENLGQTELRDSESGFVAYVPKGSIAEGERLAKTGSGKSTACVACHGPDLRGIGSTPALAGRSPSYLVRQLYDIRHGARGGPSNELMQSVVRNLNQDDFIAVAAYAASRSP
ncbi:MAG TPA: c-type cytochrome [Alphaproteobacteria bacterium]|nr:c-type cytochrome [Alphaproteobacteria bacterium]